MRTRSLTLTILAFAMLFGTVIPIVPPHQAMIVLQGESAREQFSVLVEGQTDLTSSDVELLQSYGTVTTVAGPIAVLHTSPELLPEIGRFSFVVRIERSYPLSVQLDRSVPDTGAPQVWDEVKDPSGRNVTGAGVIVGFVDTGIDTTHPDFSFPNGTTKILYVWDQTTPGRPPAGFGYGYECDSVDIETKACPEVDTFGHGTHVAGIATSSGVATGNYKGIAPGARIIFVKSGYEVCNGESWTFGTDQILDGVNYIVQKAAKLRMRAVISLSLGGNIGAHDGSDPFERALDAFVREGTPIVVAAGNSAQDQDHIDGRISQDQNTTFQLGLRESTTDVAIDIWYSNQDQLSATLHAPDDSAYTQPKPGGTYTKFGFVNITSASFVNGNELYIEFNSTNTLALNGWSVSLVGAQVHSEALWNAWTDSFTCNYPGSYFLPGANYSVDPQDTIGIPATAKYVVSVGAYITKNSWRGADGQTYPEDDLTVGDIASFSSLGPTRDGRIKPDIVAPGEFIASARSSDVPKSPSDPDNYHRVLAGTSMATPHVAGAIALMLQYDPNLDAMDVPQILRQTARLDAFTGLDFNGSATWGFGKLDARTATGLLRQTVVITGVPSTVNIPIQTNGTTTLVAGDSWTNFYFPKGSSYSVSFNSPVQPTPGTRYVLDQVPAAPRGMSALLLANYTTQYLLTVDSPFGPTSGSGWYDENTNATIASPPFVPAPGIAGYLGQEYVQAYWKVSNGGTLTSNVVPMNAPTSVTAVYTLTLLEPTFIEVLLTSIVIIGAAILFARKKLS